MSGAEPPIGSAPERGDGPPLRVAYLVNQYPLGSHTFVRREVRALESLGVQVERFSIRDTTGRVSDPADVEELGKTTAVLGPSCVIAAVRTALVQPVRFLRALAEANRFRSAARLGWLRALAMLAEACHFARLCRARGVTHAHAHFGTNSAAVAMLAKMLGGVGYSFTVHGPEEFDWPVALRLTAKMAAAEFVVAVSSFGRSQLCRWAPVDQWGKLHVVRCGIDDSFLKSDPTPVPAEPRLVCVGRLCEQKGQLLLVEAAAVLRDRGVEFEVRLVGDGPMRGDLERAIAAAGLERHVTLVGWCDGAKVRDEILAARGLVLSSFAEGLPVVLMEAMALGRPVIATYIAGIPELVEHGKNGWLTPAGSTGARADAMAEALAAPADTLAQRGAAGRRAAAERHDAHREARRLAELLKAAAG